MFNKLLYSSVMLLILGGLNACSRGNEKQHEITEKPVAVTLATVSAGTPPAILASGEVEAVQTANISTRVMGRITGIFVKTGDRVHKGQLLATVWDEDIKAKRAQADAMIAEAEAAHSTA